MRPQVAALTPAPLRNRIRARLDAPAGEVWALLGDLVRFPEYSAGLERVEATVDANGRCTNYVCHFKPAADGEPGIVEQNLIRWYEPGLGYASCGAPGNVFGLTDDLHLVTVEPFPDGTLVTFDEYFDAADLQANRDAFDQALVDAAERLIARFGGRLLERYKDSGERALSAPERTVSDLVNAVNRGDLDGALSRYEPEAVLVAEPGCIARRRAQIREALEGFIALRPTLVTSASHLVESGDVALYLGRWSLTGIGPDGALVRMGGESADVLRRHTDGHWLIALDNPWGASLLPHG
jgi:ketosteroid isomerase-like protein